MAIGGLVTDYLGASLISRIAANEASAIASLRSYNSAMVTYSSACPDIGYLSLESLGPGSKDCNHLDVVSEELAAFSPVRNGYRLVYHPLRDRPAASYQLSAVPLRPGSHGRGLFLH